MLHRNKISAVMLQSGSAKGSCFSLCIVCILPYILVYYLIFPVNVLEEPQREKLIYMLSQVF